MKEEVLKGQQHNDRSVGDVEPSEKQEAFINDLAAFLGIEVDVAKIKDKRTASEIIDALQTLRQNGLGKSEG